MPVRINPAGSPWRTKTLFLDEITELSPAIQAKLLRVLEHKQYEPLGSSRPVKADVRIIAATNKDLEKEVQKHRFRRDLYFRLNVVSFSLSPLRERRVDIPLLVNHFIERFNALQGRRILRCSQRVMSVLMRHSFMGNVLELENAIEHAFVVCGDNIIELSDLPPHLVSTVSQNINENQAPEDPLKVAEAKTIQEALERHQGNRKSAAAALGISRAPLWRKMRRLSIY